MDMDERFEAIREKAYRTLDGLMHKLDTVYTPVNRERRVLRSVEAQKEVNEESANETLDLKTRHKMQEEALKKQREEQGE